VNDFFLSKKNKHWETHGTYLEILSFTQ